MILRAVAHSTLRRLARPGAWAAILGFQVAWLLAHRLSGQSWNRVGAWEFFVPALFFLGHLAFAPAPWQWSADEQPLAPAARGILQALLWNSAWVLLLLGALADHVRPPKPPPRAESLEPPRPPPPPGPPQEVRLLFLNLPFAMVLGWFLAGKERAESREADLQEKARHARALALQAQLHPHALYNLLGGLTELVHEDPDAAEKAIVGLVDLLRMLTRQAGAPRLPLRLERALLRRYLAIEAIRLGDRLQVQWDWPEWADAEEIPPLLLQPLVENALKHGISPHPEGGLLKVSIDRDAGVLRLRVYNTGAPFDPAAPEGTGLSNLRERLALLPSLAPTFELRRENGGTLAELRLRTTLAP